jgi:hypothetical protein
LALSSENRDFKKGNQVLSLLIKPIEVFHFISEVTIPLKKGKISSLV